MDSAVSVKKLNGVRGMHSIITEKGNVILLIQQQRTEL